MKIFSANDSRTVVAWGPTTSVTVSMPAISGVINDSWLLTGLSIEAHEIVDIRQCFNDVSYIYALGNNQSRCSATMVFTIFVGSKECKDTNNFKAIKSGIDGYKSHRISKMKTPTQIQVGGFACKGWVTGISVSQLDPSTGTCQGAIETIMQLG